MNNCSDLPPLDKLPLACENIVGNRLEKVFFNPISGDVFDDKRNYIGKGKMEDGMLIITPKPTISPYFE